jgi:hypothetical protein
MLALACAAVAAGSLAGAASADSGLTGTMSNCTGPSGTPTVIVWEKQSVSGGALHIVGTKQTFNRQGAFDLTLDVMLFAPPAGLVSSGLMVTCEGVSPLTGDDVQLYGKIAQTSS